MKPKTQSKEPAGKKNIIYGAKKNGKRLKRILQNLKKNLIVQEEMNHQGDDFTRLQELQNDVSETEAQLEEKWHVGNI